MRTARRQAGSITGSRHPLAAELPNTPVTSPPQTQRRRAPARWQADLTLAFIAFTWGTTFVITKNALADVSTLLFLALRFSLATACMLPLLLRNVRTPGDSLWRGLLGGAIPGFFLWLGYILQTFGLRFTSAAHSGFLTSLYIVCVPLVGALLYRKWPRKLEVLGVVLAGAGIMWLTKPPGSEPFRLNG